MSDVAVFVSAVEIRGITSTSKANSVQLNPVQLIKPLNCKSNHDRLPHLTFAVLSGLRDITYEVRKRVRQLISPRLRALVAVTGLLTAIILN